MSTRPNRTFMKGLRTADPNTLMVLTQDVLRQPLVHIHPECLADLLALAEHAALPKPLVRDLAAFREQMFRELRDIPDGLMLDELLEEFAALPPGHIPAGLRDAVLARNADNHLDGTAGGKLVAQLAAAFAAAPPEPVKPGSVVKRLHVERPSVPDSHRAPDERKGRSSAATPAPSRTPSAQRDTRREEWIREDVVDRLSQYGARGLKEAILVAGALHRSPFEDLAEDEIRSVLRRLAKDGVARLVEGRWVLAGRRS